MTNDQMLHRSNARPRRAGTNKSRILLPLSPPRGACHQRNGLTNYFDMLGLHLGRFFFRRLNVRRREFRGGFSYGFWQRRFGGDSEASASLRFSDASLIVLIVSLRQSLTSNSNTKKTEVAHSSRLRTSSVKSSQLCYFEPGT